MRVQDQRVTLNLSTWWAGPPALSDRTSPDYGMPDIGLSEIAVVRLPARVLAGFAPIVERAAVHPQG